MMQCGGEGLATAHSAGSPPCVTPHLLPEVALVCSLQEDTVAAGGQHR